MDCRWRMGRQARIFSHGLTRISTDKGPVGGAERTGRSAHARRHRSIAVVRKAIGRWTEELRLKQRGGKVPTMSTVQEIERAIEHLPADEFFKLGEWFDDQRERLWDERIARDAQSGRLDFLIEEARAARKSGTLRPFP